MHGRDKCAGTLLEAGDCRWMSERACPRTGHSFMMYQLSVRYSDGPLLSETIFKVQTKTATSRRHK